MTYPPPPQGGQPYPPQQPVPPQGGYAYPPQQPQQPYSQPQFTPPPPQQQPYPPQQGPYPPQQPQQQWAGPPAGPPQQPWAGGPPPVAPQPSGGKRSVMGILRGIGAVVAVVIFVVAWIAGMDDADSAEVGDCMTNHGTTISPDLEVVDCGTAEAEFEVSAVHDDTTDTDLCSDGTIAYTETITRRRGSDTSFVLCLTESS